MLIMSVVVFIIIAFILLSFIASGIFSYVHQIKHVEGVFSHESDARIWGMPPNTFVLTVAVALGLYLIILFFPYRTIISRANRTHLLQQSQIDSMKRVTIKQQKTISSLDSLTKKQQDEIQRLKTRNSSKVQKGEVELSVGTIHLSVDSVKGIVR